MGLGCRVRRPAVATARGQQVAQERALLRLLFLHALAASLGRTMFAHHLIASGRPHRRRVLAVAGVVLVAAQIIRVFEALAAGGAPVAQDVALGRAR